MTDETSPATQELKNEFRACVTELIFKFESSLHAGRPAVIDDAELHELTFNEAEYVRESCRRLEFLYSVSSPIETPLSSNSSFSTGNSRDRYDSKIDEAALFGVLGARIGRFEILRGLGMGGHGIVFLARDPQLDRLVALKVPRPEVLVSSSLRRRFVLEGRVLALLSHPNIVTIFESGEAGAVCYLVQDYIPGPSLDVWLEQNPSPVNARVAARFMLQLANAVALAHSHKILHRDIKPSNILLAPGQNLSDQIQLSDFVPKLADFGLAKFVKLGEVTHTQGVVGTPSYMAPEQTAGRTQEVAETTDVYALGAVLYEVMTGRRVTRNSTVPLEQTEAVSPRSLNSTVPRDLDAICLKCLRNDPTERYESAAALEADLRNFLDGNSVRARRLTVRERIYRWARANRTITFLAGIATIFSLAVLLIVVNSNRNLREFNRRIQDEKQRADIAHRKAEKQQQQVVDAYAGLISNVIDKLHTANGTQGFRDEVFAIIDRDLPTIIDPDNLQDRRSVLTYLDYLCRLADSQERAPQNARQTIDLARNIVERETQKSTADAEMLTAYAKVLTISAAVARLQSNIAACLADSLLCIQVCEKCKSIGDHTVQCLDLMSQSYAQAGFAQVATERYRDALASYIKSTEVLEELRLIAPTRNDFLTKLIQNYRFVGDVGFRDLKDAGIARPAYEKAWSLLKPQLNVQPIHFRVWLNVSAIQRGIGDIALSERDYVAADQAFQISLEAALKAADTDADSTSRVFHELTVGYDRLAKLALARCDFEAAHANFVLSIETLKRLFSAFPTNWTATMNYEYVAVDMLKLGDLPRAHFSINEAIRLLEKRPIDQASDMGRELSWIRARRTLLKILVASGKQQEARQLLDAQWDRIGNFRKSFPLMREGNIEAARSLIVRGDLLLDADAHDRSARELFEEARKLLEFVVDESNQTYLVQSRDEMRKTIEQRIKIWEMLQQTEEEGLSVGLKSPDDSSVVVEAELIKARNEINRNDISKAIERAESLINIAQSNPSHLMAAATIYGEVHRRSTESNTPILANSINKVRSLFSDLDSMGHFRTLKELGELRISAAFNELGRLDPSNPFYLKYQIRSFP